MDLVCVLFMWLSGCFADAVAGLYSLSMILLPEVSSIKSQQYVGLLVGATLAMSGVMGPLLGGALTEYANWRWVFWIKCVLPPLAL